jgi:hypothetical protein
MRKPIRTIVLYCWILEVSDRVFAVKIKENKPVYELKEVIFKKSSNALAGIDVFQLGLWKVRSFLHVDQFMYAHDSGVRYLLPSMRNSRMKLPNVSMQTQMGYWNHTPYRTSFRHQSPLRRRSTLLLMSYLLVRDFSLPHLPFHPPVSPFSLDDLVTADSSLHNRKRDHEGGDRPQVEILKREFEQVGAVVAGAS